MRSQWKRRVGGPGGPRAGPRGQHAGRGRGGDTKAGGIEVQAVEENVQEEEVDQEVEQAEQFMMKRKSLEQVDR